MSHPTWVRGLKPTIEAEVKPITESHPTWVRGLKQINLRQIQRGLRVAPYVGAWIET